MTHHGARLVTPRSDAEWLTQGEAAALTGVPLTTIEWWASSAKIQTRSRDLGPTLNRASLIAYITQREADRNKPRPSSPRKDPRTPIAPPSEDWIGVPQAAEMLDRTAASVSRIAQAEGIDIQRTNGRLWLYRPQVERLATARATWISSITASTLTGFSTHAIEQAVRAGHVEYRETTSRGQPRLSRSSVVRWAEEERERRAQEAARRAEERTRNSPPTDGHEWISVASAARVLGLHQTRVRQLIDTGRLPSTRRGHRTWLRLDHVEAARNARDAQAAHRTIESGAAHQR